MTTRFPRFTAARRAKALAEAEKAFGNPDIQRGKRKFVQLRTSEIEERLELFQPREFSYGARSVDGDWAKDLARRMAIQGELDPVLVIRIGRHWVCVDGHHRIAAYRLRNHKKPIKCEWFAGTPAEAIDESMRRNNKDSLSVLKADRSEEAWRRVLLNMGSKKTISTACGVSTTLISEMRRVKARYTGDPDFAKRVRVPLMETSWGVMKLAMRDDDPDEANLDDIAERLAKAINGRLTDRLKRDPVVTALALKKYDPTLPKNLVDIYQGRMPAPNTQRAPITDGELRKQAEMHRHRAEAIEAELARRIEVRPEVHQEAEANRQSDLQRLQRQAAILFPENNTIEPPEPFRF